MSRRKDAFVIMPFSSTTSCSEAEWTEVFENVFVPALDECGFFCTRAVPSTGSLITSIVERLRTSWLVLADVTDHNPNVFYELGVRHSLSKRTIIVCQDTGTIPSDLKGYWTLRYGIRPAEVSQFRRDMIRLVSEIVQNPEKSDSPVSDYLEREQAWSYEHTRRDNIKKLGALFTELSGNKILLDRLGKSTGTITDAMMVSTDCLSRLLQTIYIDLGPEVLKEAYELQSRLRAIQWLEPDMRATFLPAVVAELSVFANRILDVRARLVAGEYDEPFEVSTMVWEFPFDETPPKEARSMCYRLRLDRRDVPQT